MVNNTFRQFSGKAAILSLNGRDLMCLHNSDRFNLPASYIVRDGLVYGYKSSFENAGIIYVVYSFTDLSFSKLVSFVEKSPCPTLIEFCND